MKRTACGALAAVLLLAAGRVGNESDVERLVGAMRGETPLIADLRVLSDEIGGRPTGSEANRRSVDWALERFREAGVDARREPFEMPALWLEQSAAARVEGDVSFPLRAAAMTYSPPTRRGGLTAPLVDGGRGSEQDFVRLGDAVRGAWVLIETDELTDVPGLFREYARAAEIETRAFAAGVAGLAFMGSRPRGVLYRHNASRGPRNERPLVVLERGGAQRALRLIRAGRSLRLRADLEVITGPTYTAENVIAEIRGSELPEEYVLIGAHLDSWGLGTGALDNGCNVVLVIDLARQIRRLGLRPRRTIRFALFNGEEQGIYGSWGYTKSHADELDGHVMASSYDIGSGRITGFFTNGREELAAALNQVLEPVRDLGPFESSNLPVVGTDNLDFMLEGVANLVANQESANYGPNYHAATDTFDKVDRQQLRRNAAVAAAVTWGFAHIDAGWRRHDRSQVQALIDGTDLGSQMRIFGLWEAWEEGRRGRRE